jgi:hypothetical protein
VFAQGLWGLRGLLGGDPIVGKGATQPLDMHMAIGQCM